VNVGLMKSVDENRFDERQLKNCRCLFRFGLRAGTKEASAFNRAKKISEGASSNVSGLKISA
jgi:hypothetical protein